MKINVTTICWNESKIIRKFIEHYLSNGIDHIYVYDNMSTDGCDLICAEYDKVTVLKYESNGQIRDDIYLEIKNESWKSRESDWNIVVDCDEFLHPSKNYDTIRSQLQDYCKIGITLPIVIGANAVHDEYDFIFDSELKMYAIDSSFNKRCIFTPRLSPIYLAGCHRFIPNTTYLGGIEKDALNPKNIDPFFLFHMKYINLENVISRYAEMNLRLSEYNKSNSYGVQYQMNEVEIRRLFKFMKRYAISYNELMAKFIQ